MTTWLEQLTAIPAIAGREEAVIEWVRRWVARRSDLRMVVDQAGNLVISQKRRSHHPPLWITAHMDHPGFLLTGDLGSGRFEYEFRGGVLDAYFVDASVHIFNAHGRRPARIETLDHSGRDRRGVLRVTGTGPSVNVGDIGRWAFSERQLGVRSGHLYAPACDDLAGVAAAITALDRLRNVAGAGQVSVLLTRAEEVGFIGAIAAATSGTIPEDARLVCVEMSRSYADSPIGGGPVVRVGDASSVFSSWMTGVMTDAANDLTKRRPGFRYQRKLMPGGSCEATAFMAYGYEATCLCLPLGNYHNMGDLPGVEAGGGPAKIAPEFISLADHRWLVDLLVRSGTVLDEKPDRLRNDLDAHYAGYADLLRS